MSAEVRARRAVRGRRNLAIRVRVAATAATVFIALFATIYIRYASGNDPVLGPQAAAAAQAAAAQAAAAQAAAQAATSSSAAAAVRAPVTTSQS